MFFSWVKVLAWIGWVGLCWGMQTPLSSWTPQQSLTWLTGLPPSVGVKLSREMEAGVTGTELLQALGSVRELSESFGLTSLKQRLMFEAHLKEVAQGDSVDNTGDVLESTYSFTSGGVFSPSFLEAAKPLYKITMGCENMGTLLYSLIRFSKPKRVVEIGGGFTTLFILQALKDNADELTRIREAHPEQRKVSAAAACPRTRLGELHPVSSSLSLFSHHKIMDWCWYDERELQSRPDGALICIDNMQHQVTTANGVVAVASKLGLSNYLQLLEEDAFDGCSEVGPGEIDLLWLDFGAGSRTEEVLDLYWKKVSGAGGYLAFHSTLTNQRTRNWVESMRRAGSGDDSAESQRLRDKYGNFEMVSLLEPHKTFQNSVTLLQKRGPNYAEPVYSEYA
ncbi:unnamed protein product [Chrysoparadoxa australica]